MYYDLFLYADSGCYYEAQTSAKCFGTDFEISREISDDERVKLKIIRRIVSDTRISAYDQIQIVALK